MARHKPFLQALVDIKGSSENLSLTVKLKGRNKTRPITDCSYQRSYNRNVVFLYL